MKKFLLLLILFVIKLNAYEYLIYNRPNSTSVLQGLYTDINGRLYYRIYYASGEIQNSVEFFYSLNAIKHNTEYYIRNEEFQNIYKNDLIFLNDLYINTFNKQMFLNYLYNDNVFSSNYHVNYVNYELLYNNNGLVVASIVNGQWAGLYDNSTIGSSGNLYNSNGFLVYVNGQEPSFFQKLWVRLSEPLMKDFMDANSGLIPLKWILAFIIIFMLVYFCIRLYKNAIGVEKWKI